MIINQSDWMSFDNTEARVMRRAILLFLRNPSVSRPFEREAAARVLEAMREYIGDSSKKAKLKEV